MTIREFAVLSAMNILQTRNPRPEGFDWGPVSAAEIAEWLNDPFNYGRPLEGLDWWHPQPSEISGVLRAMQGEWDTVRKNRPLVEAFGERPRRYLLTGRGVSVLAA